jgi:Cu+-exporting ATPase
MTVQPNANKLPDGATPTTARDPICGVRVDPAMTPHHSAHQGRAFYFCSAGCKARFAAIAAHEHKLASPEEQENSDLQPLTSHASEALTPPNAATTALQWICPTHREVMQDSPGACPQCGMVLEKKLASAVAQPDHELADMRRRLWFALVLTLPVLILETGGHLIPVIHQLVPPRASAWTQFVLATPVVLWVGKPIFERAWLPMATPRVNTFKVIATGAGVAWLYSVVALLAPGIFPSTFRTPEGLVPLQFAVAAVIIVLGLLRLLKKLRAR